MPRSARDGDRAAARATAIAAGSAAAVYAERGTLANGLAAWHPNRAHNKVIGAPRPPAWREPPSAPSRRSRSSRSGVVFTLRYDRRSRFGASVRLAPYGRPARVSGASTLERP